MATATVSQGITTEERTALKAARRAQRDLSKSELARALIVCRKFFEQRGRPSAERAGLMGPARVLAERSEGWIVRNLVG